MNVVTISNNQGYKSLETLAWNSDTRKTVTRRKDGNNTETVTRRKDGNNTEQPQLKPIWHDGLKQRHNAAITMKTGYKK